LSASPMPTEKHSRDCLRDHLLPTTFPSSRFGTARGHVRQPRSSDCFRGPDASFKYALLSHDSSRDGLVVLRDGGASRAVLFMQIPSILATTRARGTHWSSLPRWSNRLAEVSAVASASAVCFVTIGGRLNTLTVRAVIAFRDGRLH
jgi:hypothetical protein